MTTSTVPVNFEESGLEDEDPKIANYSGGGGGGSGAAQLNSSSSTGKNGSRRRSLDYNNGAGGYRSSSGGTKKGGGMCGGGRMKLIFGICLLLILLAFLLPILILAAKIYQNMKSDQGSSAQSRSANALQAEEAKKLTGVAEETPKDGGAGAGENTEETYRNEPWRRDPTGSWKQLGTWLSQSIDTGGDPCADFYAFTCDQWKERNPLTDEDEQAGIREKSDASMRNQVVKDIIVNTLNGITDNDGGGDTSWPKSVRWAKKFYDRCVSADEKESAERSQGIIDFLSKAVAASSPSSSSAHDSSGRTNELHRSAREAEHSKPNNNETTISDIIPVGIASANGEHNATEPELVPAPPIPGHEEESNNNMTSSPPVGEAVPAEPVSNVTAADGFGEPENSTVGAVGVGEVENVTTAVVAEALPSDIIPTFEGNNTDNNTEPNTTVNETAIVPSENVPAEAAPSAPAPSPASSEPKLDVWKLAGAISQNGIPSLFNVLRTGTNSDEDSSDAESTTPTTTILSPPSLSIPNRRSYLEPFLFAKESPNLIKSIVKKIKALKDTSSSLFGGGGGDLSSVASGILQIEQALAKASPSGSSADLIKSATSSTARTFLLSQLKSRWPSINWDGFLRVLPSTKSNKNEPAEAEERTKSKRSPEENKSEGGDETANRTTTSSSNKNETSSFIVTDPSYVDQLAGLVADNDQSKIENYLKWRYVDAVGDYLPPSSSSSSPGTGATKDLNNTCYESLQNSFPLVLAHIVYKTNYSLTDEEKKPMIYTPESIQYIFNRTVHAFKSDSSSKQKSTNNNQASPNSSQPQQQVSSIDNELDKKALLMQWPDFVTDGNKLDRLYVADRLLVEPENATFLEMFDSLRRSSAAAGSSNPSASVWSKAIPDAFTEPTLLAGGGDRIAVVSCPRILNARLSSAPVGQFATIGWQLARELAKSLRSSAGAVGGRSADQCLVDEYNQFCYPRPINECVDGAGTLEENAADNAALRVSYKAYSAWASVASSSGAGDAFPAYLVASNLGKFTTDQIFLLAYGASFCSNEANAYTSEQLGQGRKAPNKYRVIGPAQNLDDFQLAFRCKAGDKMHKDAKERCQ